jgi:hypothetical protein
MAPLCREFGISRVTGYKIFERYKACGLDGLYDRSKRAVPAGQQAAVPGRAGDPRDQEGVPLLGRAEDPRQADPRVPDDPAAGGEHDPRRARPQRPRQAPQAPALQGLRHAAVRRSHAQRTVVRRLQGRVPARQPQYCYPLTITDYRSRYLLACEGLESTKSEFAFSVFERTFRTSAYRPRSAPTTARPSPRPGRCSACPASPSGGCA